MSHHLESPFVLSELFFSHTDRKGHIRYGNDVFIRVGEYSFAELEGKPHSVVRHSDMPKIVFKLLWSSILANRPIVAYVKNMTKTGKYYWVLALVFPFQEGFLSIRLKPSSDIFKLIPNLYAKVLETERRSGIAASQECLETALHELGYASYEEFMLRALAEELRSRTEGLRHENADSAANRSFLRTSQTLETIHRIEKELDRSCLSFQEEFKRLKLLCINMLVSTTHYGQAGLPIAVTSQTFTRWGADISSVLDRFLEKQKSFSENSTQASLLLNMAFLQVEMSEFFKRSENKSAEYVQSLESLARANVQSAERALTSLNAHFNDFMSALNQLTESLLAMKIVKLNSRIESVHLPDGGTHIANIVTNISEFISLIEDYAKKISTQTDAISLSMKDIEPSRAACEPFDPPKTATLMTAVMFRAAALR